MTLHPATATPASSPELLVLPATGLKSASPNGSPSPGKLPQARRLGFSDQELLNHYDPPLSQADLDAVWDYFDHHKKEIEEAIRENEEA